MGNYFCGFCRKCSGFTLNVKYSQENVSEHVLVRKCSGYKYGHIIKSTHLEISGAFWGHFETLSNMDSHRLIGFASGPAF